MSWFKWFETEVNDAVGRTTTDMRTPKLTEAFASAQRRFAQNRVAIRPTPLTINRATQLVGLGSSNFRPADQALATPGTAVGVIPNLIIAASGVLYFADINGIITAPV